MVNQLNDATPDAAQTVDAANIVGDASFLQTDVYDLKQLDPSTFNVTLNWSWVPAAGAYQIVTVVGSTDAAATDSYILGMQVLGDPATVATVLGVTPSGDWTGSGNYTIQCSNVGMKNVAAIGGQQRPVVCRFVSVAVQTVGAGSLAVFAAKIDHN